MKKYVYKWDLFNKVLTPFVLISLLWALYVSFVPFMNNAPVSRTSYLVFVILLIFVVPTIIAPFFLCPISLQKEGDTLWINFLLRKKKIDLRGCEVETPRRVDFSAFWRTFGSAGYFGYWGRFKKGAEPYVFYMTDRREDVCIISSPDEKQKILLNAPHEWFEQEVGV